MTAAHTLLAPLSVTIGVTTTVLPTMSANLQWGEQNTPIRHSGLPFNSGCIVEERQVRVVSSIPFGAAYAAFSSLKLVECSALKFYMRDFSAGLAAGTGDEYSLKTGAKAYGHIRGFSEGDGGLINADVEWIITSGGSLTGLEDVLDRTGAQTIPTVASEPTYYRRGPLSLDGGSTTLDGPTGISYTSGNRVIPIRPTDGRVYAESVIYDGGYRTFSIPCDDIRQANETIGEDGIEIGASSTIVYLRQVERNGKALATGGISLAIDKGRVTVDGVSGSVGGHNSGTVNIMSSNNALDQTDPVTVTTGVAVP